MRPASPRATAGPERAWGLPAAPRRALSLPLDKSARCTRAPFSRQFVCGSASGHLWRRSHAHAVSVRPKARAGQGEFPLRTMSFVRVTSLSRRFSGLPGRGEESKRAQPCSHGRRVCGDQPWLAVPLAVARVPLQPLRGLPNRLLAAALKGLGGGQGSRIETFLSVSKWPLHARDGNGALCMGDRPLRVSAPRTAGCSARGWRCGCARGGCLGPTPLERDLRKEQIIC